MLNQLVRYAPVVRMLRDETGTIAEVGSGAAGIAPYLGREVIGLEIRFLEEPNPLLLAVGGSATALPFADSSIDVVLVMDTLEHIPRSLRDAAIAETARVARRRIIVGGPMGARARGGDERIAAGYRRRGEPLPDWLGEHLTEEPPTVDEVLGGLRAAGWDARARGNENLHAHVALLRAEQRRFWFRVFGRVRRHAAGAAQAVALAMRVPPYYSYLVEARPAAAASHDSAMRSTNGPQS